MTEPASETVEEPASDPGEATDEPQEDENPDAETPEPIEGDEPAEPSAEPAAPDAPPLSEKDLEKGMKRLEGEQSRHANRISEIMGEEAQLLVPCELCAPLIPGFRWPVQPPDDVKERVRFAIGDAQPRKLLRDQYSGLCEACGGEGAVDTQSHVQGQMELPCLKCGGKGWQPIGNERRVGYIPPPPAIEYSNGSPAEEQSAAVVPPEVAALRAQGYVILDPVR